MGIVALKAPYIGLHQGAIEERVFAVAFFGASPARVAAKVCIRGADDEAAFSERLVGPARFISFDRRRLPDKRCVPGLRHSIRLREDRSRDRCFSSPAAGNAESEAMQPFAVAGTLQA